MIDTRAVAQEVQEQLTAAVHRGQEQMRKSQDQVRKGREAVTTAVKAGGELAKAIRPALPTSAIRVSSLTSPDKLKASVQEFAEQVVASQRSFVGKAKQAAAPVAEQVAATQRSLADKAKQAAGPVAEQIVATQRSLAGKAVHAASPIVTDGMTRLTQAVTALIGGACGRGAWRRYLVDGTGAIVEREPLASRGIIALELHGPHVIGPFVVDFFYMADEGVEDLGRLNIVVAVFEIDIVGFQAVAAADAGPEVFVCREGRRGVVVVVGQALGQGRECKW